MKILVFTSLFPNNIWPHHGVFVKERITRLAHLPGIDLRVIAPVPYFPELRINQRWLYSQVVRQETIEGLEVYHPRYFLIPKIGMFAYGGMMALSLRSFLIRFQQSFAFDIIDAHYVYPDGFAAVQLSRLLNKPVVITARGTDVNLFAKFRTIRPLLSRCLSRADRVITVCQALKDAVAGLNVPARNIHVIPNGVDATKFHPITTTEARQILNLPAGKKIVLSVGGLVERKGFDILIRAMRVLREKYGHSKVLLIIAGEGEERDNLAHLIALMGLSSSIRLVGDIPHDRLYLWYSAADVFCLASSREGWPNVIMESLACGTPVVASNIWGIPEIISDDRLGLLCDRNASSFAEKISLALSMQWDRRYPVDYARTHTWECAAQSVKGVLADVLRSRISVT